MIGFKPPAPIKPAAPELCEDCGCALDAHHVMDDEVFCRNCDNCGGETHVVPSELDSKSSNWGPHDYYGWVD